MSADPGSKPVLIFDGDCAFCRRWVERWRNIAGDAVEFVPYQQADARFPQIPPDDFGRAIHLVEPDGTVHRGAGAVFRMLAYARHKRWLDVAYRRLPGFASVAELVYDVISNNRGPMDRVDRAMLGKSTEPVTYYKTRAIFLRGLGLIYLFAFLSLWVQLDGLIGSHGITPAHDYLAAVRDAFPTVQRFHLLPTLCWIGATDTCLHALCLAGVALSVALILGLIPSLATVGLWLLYLSLVRVGPDFLEYQWDALLLEAGFLAIWFSSVSLLLRTDPSRTRPPGFGILMLLRWLLFRVMFLSGVVKLSSHDPTWRNLTAMSYHYWTQPLPTWTSWYIAQSPMSVHKAETLFTFLTELWLPLFIFAPRRARKLAFWGTIVLQLLIIATGNFGFFNLLTIVLCVTLVDDGAWTWNRRRRDGAQRDDARSSNAPRADPPVRPLQRSLPPLRWCAIPLALIALYLFLASLAPFIRSFGIDAPEPLLKLYAWVSPYRLSNGYGLFAVMTATRPEIIVEGSADGVTWKPYTFRWKPGDDLTRRPRFCTPHMPRLDWQLWFEALYAEGGSGNRWFPAFLRRLLHNEPAVLALLAPGGNPFPDEPPLLVRARLYHYEFTTFAERSATGAWWKRTYLGEYIPPISRRTFGD